MTRVSGRQVALPSILLDKFKIIGSYLEKVGSPFGSPEKVGLFFYLFGHITFTALTVSRLFGFDVVLKNISNARHVSHCVLY